MRAAQELRGTEEVWAWERRESQQTRGLRRIRAVALQLSPAKSTQARAQHVGCTPHPRPLHVRLVLGRGNMSLCDLDLAFPPGHPPPFSNYIPILSSPPTFPFPVTAVKYANPALTPENESANNNSRQVFKAKKETHACSEPPPG